MKYLSKVVILLLLHPLMAYNQDYIIKGKINDLPDQKIYFSSFHGDKNIKIDTITTSKEGSFEYHIPSKLPTGMYRINMLFDQKFELILNGENIVFETSFNDPSGKMVISESEENAVYYNFLQLDNNLQLKLELLTPIIDFYPDDDDFFKKSQRHYEEMQETYSKKVEHLIMEHNHTLASRIAMIARTPRLPASLKTEQRMDYLKAHFFDHTDFTDSALIKSNAYINKAIDYLTLYANPNFTKEQLEKQYIKAIDIILSYAVVCNEVYDFLLEYFVNGFEKYNFELVLDHISLNYSPSNKCENKERKSQLEKRLESYQKLVRGNKVPEIISKDQERNPIILSELKSNYTLVVFWATWCPHCKSLLPEIKKSCDILSADEIKILAVSLDTLQNDWLSFIKSFTGNWVHCSDLKGWNSKAADDYSIYATPTMFLLDINKKILAKPVTYNELYAALRENGILK
ncbi:thioredoxin-like domain-containing protein [Bacteroidota bacterium]